MLMSGGGTEHSSEIVGLAWLTDASDFLKIWSFFHTSPCSLDQPKGRSRSIARKAGLYILLFGITFGFNIPPASRPIVDTSDRVSG
jgi:hypothetical protein